MLPERAQGRFKQLIHEMLPLIRKAAPRGVSALFGIRNCTWSVLIVFLLPVIIYLPSLLGWWSIDPILFFAQVASSQGKHILPGAPWLDPDVGWQAQALGKLSADEWLAGRIPWWNYYSGVGFPLAAEAQPGALFLPFVLLNHFANGTLYIKIVLQILAGLGTYFLLLKIGLMRLSAVAGAILFELSGVFALHGAPIMSPVAFLPWLVLGIEQARENSLSRRSGGSSIIAISLSLSVYAGFPETAYINGLLAGVWSLCRLFSIPLEIRYHFIKKVATGAIVGLLLSTPLIIPFAEYVGRSYLGFHNGDAGFAGISMSREQFAQILFPWLFGGISYYSDPSLFFFWGAIGGFLSAAQLTTIILGLLIARRSSLYVVLTLWITICFGRTFGTPVLSTIVDLIPLVKRIAFFRYSPPSWEFCSAVLCAIVINSMFLKGFLPRKRVIASLVLAGSIATTSLYLARDVVSRLYVNEGYRVFLWASLIWGFGCMMLIILAFWIGKNQRLAATTCAIILSVDAIALISIPTFSAVVGAKSSPTGVNYLKQHIGMDRFYTLGPIKPNYSAYYHIASINETYMPVAANWTKYLQDHVDPYAYPADFDGAFPRNSAQEPSQAQVLRQNIAEYEEIGVRYVVCPHSMNPFERTSHLATMDSGNKPFNLAGGQSVAGKMFGSQFIEAKVKAVSVLIGNYSGKSDGILKVRLSADGFSVFGERNLRESEDNLPFRIELNQSLRCANGNIQYEISKIGGIHPVALWIWPLGGGQQTHESGGIPFGYAPKLEFIHLLEQNEYLPKRVFESDDMDIYELARTRPYFEIGQADCHLRIESRSSVSVNCASEAHLIRRELYYPGWKAYVSGKKVHIEAYNGLFQTIRIPPGQHKISFTYIPTHMRFIAGSFGIGALWLVMGAIRHLGLDRKKRS